MFLNNSLTLYHLAVVFNNSPLSHKSGDLWKGLGAFTQKSEHVQHLDDPRNGWPSSRSLFKSHSCAGLILSVWLVISAKSEVGANRRDDAEVDQNTRDGTSLG